MTHGTRRFGVDELPVVAASPLAPDSRGDRPRIAALVRPGRTSLAAIRAGRAPDSYLHGTNHLAQFGYVVDYIFADRIALERITEPFRRAAGFAPIGNDFTKQLVMLHRRKGYQAIITVGLENGILLLGAKSLRAFRLPPIIVLDMHYRDRQQFGLAFRWAIRSASVASVLSTSSIAQLRSDGYHSDNLRYFPFGVDSDFFRPHAPPTDLEVLSVGHAFRDFVLLDQALDGVAHAVVASDKLPAGMRNLTRTWFDYQDLVDAYDRSKVVAIPLVKTTESVGLTVVLEAMAMGKAIVATRSGGIPDYLQHDQTALLVDPNDVSSFRTAVAHLLASPSERARLGRNARAAVLREFTTKIEGVRLSHLLKEVIS